MKSLPPAQHSLNPAPLQDTTQHRSLASGNGARGAALFENTIDTEWLTTPEAAKFLGISEGALRNMTSSGQVTYFKLGHRNRYRLVDLRALLLKERRGPNGN